MALIRGFKGVIQVVCVGPSAVVYFFLIIGVYGLRAAIGGLIIFIALAIWLIRGTMKGGADHEA